MKKTVTPAMLGSLILLSIAHAIDTGYQAATRERMTIFQVSLQCPAAPQIGCGSSAKPILLQLEHDSAVREAWLNRTGTLIAVVWKSEPTSEARRGLASRLRTAGCCASEQSGAELQGQAREAALKEFESGRGWYRGAEVDRLSEEEAGVIAARLVRRVEARTALAKDKAERLRRTLTTALKKLLIDGEEERPSAQQVAGEFLNKKQVAILQEAVDSGVRSLPGEE